MSASGEQLLMFARMFLHKVIYVIIGIKGFFGLTIYGTLTIGLSWWGRAENYARFPNLAELPMPQTSNIAQ